MTVSCKLQLTLAIIKPHIIKNPIAVAQIRDLLVSSNFKIAKFRRKTISLKEAADFYSEHKSKFFYNRLITFMTSGPSDIMILAKENAIKEWRQLMGPTKVFKAQFEAPDSIRGQFGLSDTRNASHGSDSENSARREIKIFFPDFDIDKWYVEDECLFRANKALKKICSQGNLQNPSKKMYILYKKNDSIPNAESYSLQSKKKRYLLKAKNSHMLYEVLSSNVDNNSRSNILWESRRSYQTSPTAIDNLDTASFLDKRLEADTCCYNENRKVYKTDFKASTHGLYLPLDNESRRSFSTISPAKVIITDEPKKKLKKSNTKIQYPINRCSTPVGKLRLKNISNTYIKPKLNVKKQEIKPGKYYNETWKYKMMMTQPKNSVKKGYKQSINPEKRDFTTLTEKVSNKSTKTNLLTTGCRLAYDLAIAAQAKDIKINSIPTNDLTWAKQKRMAKLQHLNKECYYENVEKKWNVLPKCSLTESPIKMINIKKVKPIPEPPSLDTREMINDVLTLFNKVKFSKPNVKYQVVLSCAQPSTKTFDRINNEICSKKTTILEIMLKNKKEKSKVEYPDVDEENQKQEAIEARKKLKKIPIKLKPTNKLALSYLDGSTVLDPFYTSARGPNVCGGYF